MSMDDDFQNELKKLRQQTLAKQTARDEADQKERDQLSQSRTNGREIADSLNQTIEKRLADLAQALQLPLRMSHSPRELSRSTTAKLIRADGSHAEINIYLEWPAGHLESSASTSETRRGDLKPDLIRKRKFSTSEFNEKDFDDWLKSAITEFVKRFE